MASPQDIRAALSDRDRVIQAVRDARVWLRRPENIRRAGLVALPLLVLVGLMLPPVSLATRLTTLDYAHVKPGQGVAVQSDVPGTSLDVDRVAIRRATRIRLRSAGDDLPGGVPDLPSGRELIAPIFKLDVRGPAPRAAWLSMTLDVDEDVHPFVDPYGYDGQGWRWLSPQFVAQNRLRVRLPLNSFVPEYVAVTRAGEGATEMSAVLLPPPASVPAAVSELPILEMRSYHLDADDGSVAGSAFAVPARDARRYAVIENLEGERVRNDLVNNILISPESRLRHREAIVDIVRRDDLDGIVLDYRGVADDLQPIYASFAERLASDLHAADAELIVTVPMPRQSTRGWEGGSYSWGNLSAAADGVRVLLPSDRPLEIDELDSMVRWALGQVERGRLQLALPVQGRDIVLGEETTAAISYGDALGRVLDMARSDAPARITPGAAGSVELPTIRAAELQRDPATGMWRFHYWDENRRQHTVWLNDAAGLKPAFDIAARYRLGRLALDGVEAGLDPSMWQMVQSFIDTGEATAPNTGYRLKWQLTDGSGRVVQQATQALGESSFAFRAPATQGNYRLGVNLVTDDNVLAALGSAADVLVAPPPPPTPRPTARLIRELPTPLPYQTAPPPADEVAERSPVRIAATAVLTGTAEAFDATVSVAEASLRDGPGVRYDPLSTLRTGDRLDLIGRNPDGSWLLVRVKSTGVEGWVLADLLQLEVPAARAPIVVTPTPTSRPGG